MDEPLYLTDDEVVALAVAQEAPWPGGLPTVDIESADRIAEAALRGNRSLIVRELGEQAPGRASVDRLVGLALDSPSTISVFLADANFRRTSWGLASMHYPSGERWVLETISPIGVHKLSEESLEDHRSYLTALVDAVAAAGPATHDATGAAESVWLCVSAFHRDGTSAPTVAARQGELICGLLEPVGEDGATIVDATGGSPSEAVATLLAAVGDPG